MAEIRVRLQLTPDTVLGNLGNVLERRLTRTAQLIEGEVVRSISVGQAVRRTKGGYLRGLGPSVEGQPPHALSGRLRQSISHAILRETMRVIARIGTNVRYAARLERGFIGTDSRGRNIHQGPRPFLRPALENNLKRLVE